MILTIRKVTEDENQQEVLDFSTQLSAPVFVLGTTNWKLYRDPVTDELTVDEPAEYEEDDVGKLQLGAAATVVENNADIVENITGKMPKSARRVLTINGITPTDDGEFFIDGSECDSWEYISGSTIGLVDLCPSCTTCETIYRLKYEVENMKMWINTLKDVNLYAGSNIATRQGLLNDQRIAPYAAQDDEDKSEDKKLCSIGLIPDDGYLQLKGLQLLQQYITTVHMWNYIVSRNNASTVIDVAPEDTTGFTVQTKRALPSCCDKQKIKCTMDVYPVGVIMDKDDAGHIVPLPSRAGVDGTDGYPISVYVPDGSNEVRFEPFWDNKIKDDGGDIKIEYNQNSVLKPYQQKSHVKTNLISHYKQISTKDASNSSGFIDATFAGTYVVTVKFLPFVYYRAWRDEVVGGQTHHVDINIRGGTSQVVVGNTNSDGSVSYDFGISGHTCYAIPPDGETAPEPTEEDYLTSKTVPTCSVKFQIVWYINIKWITSTTVNGREESKEDEETYLYTANGIRAYYGDIIGDTTVEPSGGTGSTPTWDDRLYYTEVDY